MNLKSILTPKNQSFRIVTYQSSTSMDILYVDTMTGVNLSLIQVANMDLLYWSVRSFSRKGGDGVKGLDGGYRFFSITL